MPVRAAALLALCVLGGSGCTRRAPDSLAPNVGLTQQALWSNGDFESDDLDAGPSGWTVTSNLNPGIVPQNPQTLAGLQLAPGGALATSIVGGARESQADPDVPRIVFPKFGERAVRVNHEGSSVVTTEGNVNTLLQELTLTNDDIDPGDGQLHVRFAIAPVLQDPDAHPPAERPYYFVELLDLTRNTTLVRSFGSGAESELPWQHANSGDAALAFTDWQLIDAAVGDADVVAGDTLQLRVIAAGCANGDHWGRVYVDAAGPVPTGLFVTASAPSSVSPGSSATVALRYRNAGADAVSGTTLEFTTPAHTTFRAWSGLATCTAPAVGAAGKLVCDVGAVAAGASGVISVELVIDPTTTDDIPLYDYAISADNWSRLIGPPFRLSVAKPDLAVSLSSTRPSAAEQSETVGEAYSEALDVLVLDTAGNPVPHAWVSFEAPSDGPSAWLDAYARVTTNDGHARVHAVANQRAGAFDVIARLSASAQVARFALRNRAARPARVLASANSARQRASLGMPFSSPLTVEVRDTFGNPVPGARLDFVQHAREPRAEISPTQVSTDNAGRASVSARASTVAGSYIVAARLHDGAGHADFVLSNTAEPIASVAIVRGDDAEAVVGTAFPRALEVDVMRDGKPVADTLVTFAPDDDASVVCSPSSALTDANGRARTEATAGERSGSYVLRASVDDGAQPATFHLTNLPDAPGSLEVGQLASPQATQLGDAFASRLSVTVLDGHGNSVPGVEVSFSTPRIGSSASLDRMTVTSDDFGRASVLASANMESGSYWASAAADGVRKSATFFLSNSGTPPLTLGITTGMGQSTAVDSAFPEPLSVLVTSAAADPRADAMVLFGAPDATASAELSATRVFTTGTGIARIDARAAHGAGSYQLLATLEAAASPVIFALRNVPRAAAHIRSRAGSTPQTTRVGTPFRAPLSVRVEDDFGNPVPGAVIDFTGLSADPAVEITTTSPTTDPGGTASVAAIALERAATSTLTAAVRGTELRTNFELTTTATEPTTLTLLQGGEQTTLATLPFPQPLRVALRDSYGNPVPDVELRLNFSQDAASASPLPLVVTTDERGEASVQLTANAEPGTFALNVSGDGVPSPLVTRFTVEPIPTQVTLDLSLARRKSDKGERSLEFAAFVSSEHGTPNGAVEFLVDGTQVGEGPLRDGSASFVYWAALDGDHEVLAIYPAQAEFARSSSEPGLLTIGPFRRTISGLGVDGGAGTLPNAAATMPSDGGWLGGGGCSLVVVPPSAASARALRVGWLWFTFVLWRRRWCNRALEHRRRVTRHR